MDYVDLLASLNAPPVTVWHPVREFVIAHEPPATGEPEWWGLHEPEAVLRPVPAANRPRLVRLAYAMLADAGVPRMHHPVGPGASVDYRRLARVVVECAHVFQNYYREHYAGGLPVPPGALSVAPGRLFHGLAADRPYPVLADWYDFAELPDDEEHEWALWGTGPRDAYWHTYFLEAWQRAVRYFVPVRLPRVAPRLEPFIRQLPDESRERWRAAIDEHFKQRDLGRTPSVREVAAVLLREWRTRPGITAGDVDDLVELLRHFGFSPAEDEADRDRQRDVGGRADSVVEVTGGQGRGTHTCPVCGYLGLRQLPTYPTHEICPCCGIQFGLHDADRSHAELRADWWAGGMMAWSDPAQRPADWSARAQLEAAGLDLSLADPDGLADDSDE